MNSWRQIFEFQCNYQHDINISISVGTTSPTACRTFLDLRSTLRTLSTLSTITYFTGYEHSGSGVRGNEEDREEGTGTDIKTKVGISREGSWYSHINQPTRENETSIGGFQLFFLIF